MEIAEILQLPVPLEVAPVTMREIQPRPNPTDQRDSQPRHHHGTRQRVSQQSPACTSEGGHYGHYDNPSTLRTRTPR
jgi:hypothetical protein